MNTDGITKKYDQVLLQEEHYQKYPLMLPWVGQVYGKKYKKVLFIGESHYLPDYSTAQMNAGNWYSSDQSVLDDFELSYINTRHALLTNYRRNGIWRNPAQVMAQNGIAPPCGSDNVYEHFCYYNFFQRPAQVEGKELHIAEQDVEVANRVFRANLTVLEPDLVVFLSSKSWDNAATDNMDIPVHFTPHPSSCWWNRKSKKYVIKNETLLSGKDKFTKLISLSLR